MLGFLKLFKAMSLRDSMKPQATNNQIKNTKFVLNLIFLTSKNMVYKQKHPTLDLFWKTFRLDESELPLSYIGTTCLKNVEK